MPSDFAMPSNQTELSKPNAFPFMNQAQRNEKVSTVEEGELVNIRRSVAQDAALGVVLGHTRAIPDTRSPDMLEQEPLESNQLSPFYSIPRSSRVYRNYDVATSSLRKLWKAMEWGPAFMQDKREVVQTSIRKSLYIRYNFSPWYRPKRRKTRLPGKPADLSQSGWLNTRYPFLGFAPVSLDTPGFQKLIGPDPTLCLEGVVVEVAPGFFRTHEDITNAWIFLEEQLSWLVTALISITPPSVSWARSARYPEPSSFGYQGTSSTRELQLEATVASRECFRAQIASVRALTSINWLTWRDRIVKEFDVLETWLDFLHECGVVYLPETRADGEDPIRRIHHTFWDCVGAYTTVGNVEARDLLKGVIQYGVPVWIVWGEPDVLRHFGKDPFLQKMWQEFHPRPQEVASLDLTEVVLDAIFTSVVPSHVQKPPLHTQIPIGSSHLQTALMHTEKPTEPLRDPVKPVLKYTEPSSPCFEYVLDNAEDCCDFFDMDAGPQHAAPVGPSDLIVSPVIKPWELFFIPQPYPDSGQLRGESPQEFIARRKEMLERRTLVEKVEEQQSRLTRVEFAKKKLPPGRKGAAVFEWHGIGNGQFLRQRVPKVAVEGTWGNYSENSKVYDPLKDEWDLWEGFDTSGGLPERLIEEYYSGIGYDGEKMCEGDMQELTDFVEARTLPSMIRPVQEAREFFRRNAEQMRQMTLDSFPELDENPAPMSGADEDLVESVRLRFGFVRRKGEDSPGGDISDKELDKCLFKLYWVKPKSDLDTALPGSLRCDLVALVNSIENSQGNFRSLPSNLFDLPGASPESLSRNANTSIRINPRTVVTPSERRSMEPTSKRVKQVHKTYFISPIESCHRKPAWTLMVSDPVAVLTCMRTESHDFYEIVEGLLRCGIPLHTVQTDQQAAKRSSRYCSSYLPVRLPSSTIRSTDYLQYFHRMKQLVLSNHRVARAALMRGGIIWRLVIELVRIEDVITGPSQEWLSSAVHVLRKDGSGPEVWYDDELTRQEEDIICGVFRSTDEPAHESEQLWSFWPTPNVWETSSVNSGRWTPHNEEWFTKRRDFLAGVSLSGRNAEFSNWLYYQKEWRMKLQGQKKLGLRVVKRNKELSEGYLDSVLGTPCENA